MRRLYKLQKLTEFLKTLTIEGTEAKLYPILTTAQSDATSKLAHLDGQQFLIARPECNDNGDSDQHSEIVSTAFFLLEKNLGQLATPEKEQSQYDRLLDVAMSLIEIIDAAMTDSRCGLLSGLSTESVNIMPEASLFGGWLGYSIEINLR